jgi:hypothetical protein
MADKTDKKYVQVWCEYCEGQGDVLRKYHEGENEKDNKPKNFSHPSTHEEYYMAFCPKCEGRGHVIHEAPRVCKTCKQPY